MISLSELIILSMMSALLFAIPDLRRAIVLLPYTRRSIDLSHLAVLDLMRGVAMVGVIIIHITYFYPFFFERVEIRANQINTLFRFSVPLFFIVSALLFPPLSSFKDFFSFFIKKIYQLLPPYLLVSSVVAMVHGYSWNDALFGIVTGNLAVPFWFVIVLFQLFLLYPVLQLFEKKRYFLPVLFFISFLSLFIPDILYISFFPTPFRFLFFVGLGMRLRPLVATKKIVQPHLFILIFAIVIYIVLAFEFSERVYNARLVYGPLIFLALYRLFSFFLIYKKNALRILAHIGMHSYWIYLTHFFVLEFLVYRYEEYLGGFISILLWLFMIAVCCGVGILLSICYTSIVSLCKKLLKSGKKSSHQNSIMS